VFFTESPLSAEQASRLVELLTLHSAEFQRGGDVTWTGIAWERVIADASGVLSPIQVGALRSFGATIMYRQQLAAATKSGGAGP
jgi:hypothetical protein